MKNLLWIISAVLLTMACEQKVLAIDNSWKLEDTILQTTVIAMFAVDRAQTIYSGIHDDRFEEVGWARTFLGPHPSHRKTNQYFLSCVILHTSIAYMLPKPYRELWQIFFIGIEYDAIKTNINAGISVRF